MVVSSSSVYLLIFMTSNPIKLSIGILPHKMSAICIIREEKQNIPALANNNLHTPYLFSKARKKANITRLPSAAYSCPLPSNPPSEAPGNYYQPPLQFHLYSINMIPQNPDTILIDIIIQHPLSGGEYDKTPPVQNAKTKKHWNRK